MDKYTIVINIFRRQAYDSVMWRYVILLFKVEKNTEDINTKVLKTNNNKTMLLSNYAICGSKNATYIENKKQVQY